MKPRWKQGSTWAATTAAIVGLLVYAPESVKIYIAGVGAVTTLLGVWLSDAPAA